MTPKPDSVEALIAGFFPDAVADHDGYLVHCVSHNDSHESLKLSVREDTGKFLWTCRAGCTQDAVASALAKLTGLTTRELSTLPPGNLTNRTKATPDPVTAADVAVLAELLAPYAASFADSSAVAYARERFGVTVEDGERLGLGYAEDLGGGPRLVVPFRDKDGVARGYQARALIPGVEPRWTGPKSPEGRTWSKVAYIPASTKASDYVAVCEGPGDSLAVACALGIDTVSVAGAKLASNEAVVDQIVDLLDGRNAVIFGDGDRSGRDFAATLARSLSAKGVTLKVPEVADGMDMADWRKKDPEKFVPEVHTAINAARTVEPRRSAATTALENWDEDTYALTELGAARYLKDYIESQGSGVRWANERGAFFLLENGVWREDKWHSVHSYAHDVADVVMALARKEAIAANAAAEADPDSPSTKRAQSRAKRVYAFAQRIQTSNGIRAVLTELQAVRGVPASLNDFDAEPDVVAVRNGVIDLRTGKLLPHNPNLLLTRRVDVDYDPDATCPRWEQFLREVFPAFEEIPPYLKTAYGAGLTGYCIPAVLIHYGRGANGKSVFMDTLATLCSELSVTTPFSTFEGAGTSGVPTDVASFKGARFIWAAEGQRGVEIRESLLKNVTGNEILSARYMRQDFFEFRPTAILTLASNYRPAFKGQDHGLWRRVKLMPWVYEVPEEQQDADLNKKLLQERQGILTWMVQGAMQWYANDRKLIDPKVISDATETYKETMDDLTGFLPGMYKIDPDATEPLSGPPLYEAYSLWASEEGLGSRDIMRRKNFYAALEERGATRYVDRTHGRVMFKKLVRADVLPEPQAEAPAKPEPDKSETTPAPKKNTPRLLGGFSIRGSLNER